MLKYEKRINISKLSYEHTQTPCSWAGANLPEGAVNPCRKGSQHPQVQPPYQNARTPSPGLWLHHGHLGNAHLASYRTMAHGQSNQAMALGRACFLFGIFCHTDAIHLPY